MHVTDLCLLFVVLPSASAFVVFMLLRFFVFDAITCWRLQINFRHYS